MVGGSPFQITMASKKKQIRQAMQDGTISKKEQKSFDSAGVTSDRLQNFQARQEVVGGIGKRFGSGDFKALKETGLSNNKVLKIAASTKKVNAKANNKLTKLNPGIKLPSKDETDGTYGGTLDSFSRFAGAMQSSAALSSVGKQVKNLGKNYFQWQGTDNKGRPQGLGGFKVPKSLRKGDTLSIGAKAMRKGSFGSYQGTGTLFGRDGSSLLNNKGGRRNPPTSWLPGKGSGSSSGSGSGKKGSGKGDRGGEGVGIEAPSTETGSDSSSTASGLSGVYGGTGTETFGTPTFRRRRSRTQRSGSFTQGPSRLGINLQRQSGLNIMRA